ncbi:hypothetical protein MSG28_003925 [Choristoneura fumiferana]|uniref:Uncharacterized protein n=1 Tax=Choristoneura fumiferana TaxID=7141 RepID=A0ACC0KHR3_CHOFU|nr:hypothetical protein MSG28_003925 [Choristoneura fumiferana]
MAAAFQQQIFALDARFNAYRAPNNPNFRHRNNKKVYIHQESASATAIWGAGQHLYQLCLFSPEVQQ